MGLKTTQEQKDKILECVGIAVNEEMLTGEELVKLIDFLSDVFKREKRRIDPFGFIGEFEQ